MVFLQTLFLSFFLSFPLLENQSFHALHLSTFEITNLTDESLINVRLRVFQDDFRDAIKNANPNLTGVTNSAFLIQRQAVIAQYFQQHFQLIFDDINSPISLISSQAENDIYWFRFKLTCPENWQKCKFQASYLMELFSDQSNIGTVILNGQKQFLRFTKNELFIEFES